MLDLDMLCPDNFILRLFTVIEKSLSSEKQRDRSSQPNNCSQANILNQSQIPALPPNGPLYVAYRFNNVGS